MKSDPTYKIGVCDIAEEIKTAFSHQSNVADVIFIGCSNGQNPALAPRKADNCKMGFYYLAH
jgi:hypothetical protein